MITLIIVILHCIVFNEYYPFHKIKRKEEHKYYNINDLKKFNGLKK